MRKIFSDAEGRERTFVYSSTAYYAELSTAVMLSRLNLTLETSDTEIDTLLHRVSRQSKIELDERQKEAVSEAVKHGVLILTGGPGTGKTTDDQCDDPLFEAEGLEILLAAPTGRAAKRMTEATGCQARTIHRMLELSGGPESAGGRASL